MSMIIKREPEPVEETFEQWKQRHEASGDTVEYDEQRAYIVMPYDDCGVCEEDGCHCMETHCIPWRD
jgi:hypothetical protein